MKCIKIFIVYLENKLLVIECSKYLKKGKILIYTNNISAYRIQTDSKNRYETSIIDLVTIR